MSSTLIKISEDRNTLVTEMFDDFKLHIRVLHDVEDATITMYLAAAIDAIATYASRDIFATEWQVFYPQTPDYTYPSTLYGWYCGKEYVRGITIKDSEGNDITNEYTIDIEKGMVYPHPLDKDIVISSGYVSADDLQMNLKNIIFRLGADYFENREANRVGEPKALPLWVEYAMASIWSPRI